MKQNIKLTASDYQALYEGLTQEDSTFRDELKAVGAVFEEDEIFSELDRAKNRINYAMLGISPIYRREVELAGLVDFHAKTLSFANNPDDVIIDFKDLDPAYLAFLENQKRIFDTSGSEILPLSSVALKCSNELNKDKMNTPNLEDIHMNVPKDMGTTSRQILERAFTNSMVMMTHLDRMIKKHGLDKAYGMNKDHLLQHVASDSFNNSFNRSIGELESVSAKSAKGYGL